MVQMRVLDYNVFLAKFVKLNIFSLLLYRCLDPAVDLESSLI
jgi:hypothetical protein